MPNAHAGLIARFEQGAASLRDAVRSVSPDEATTRSAPGTWSIHELVVHLADSDAIAIDRMKRVVTEDDPPLLNADECAYIERLHSHDQSMEDALTLFEVNRRQWARVLRRLSDSDFERAGVHNVAGRLTLADLVRAYSDHLDHHLRFARGKLERLRGG